MWCAGIFFREDLEVLLELIKEKDFKASKILLEIILEEEELFDIIKKKHCYKKGIMWELNNEK